MDINLSLTFEKSTQKLIQDERDHNAEFEHSIAYHSDASRDGDTVIVNSDSQLVERGGVKFKLVVKTSKRTYLKP
jgi:hypothetical protein